MTNDAWKPIISAVAVFVLAACSSTPGDSGEPSTLPASSSTDAPSASAPAVEPSEEVSPSASAASSSGGLVQLDENALFLAMPTREDATAWGLKNLRDATSGGETLNQMTAFDEMSDAVKFTVTDGMWTQVNPPACEPLQELAYPRAESDADYAAVTGYTDSPLLGPGFAENLAVIQVTVWPSQEVAEERFSKAAAVADQCGGYTVRQKRETYSAVRWDGKPRVADGYILGWTANGLGTAMGSVGATTYSIVVARANVEKVVEKANTWMRDSLSTSQGLT